MDTSLPVDRPRVLVAGFLFFLSGASALVYQVTWQRILALHSGMSLYSMAMIVAAFMAGLGLGSHLGGVISARLHGRRAFVAFALVELLVGALGVASPFLYYDLLYPEASRIAGSPWISGVLHFLALLPPTLLMGMSLPFLVQATVRAARAAGPVVGTLYGVNVLGASVGALGGPCLIPYLGIRGAVLAAAIGNVVAGLGALVLAWRDRPHDREALRQDGLGLAGPPPPPASAPVPAPVADPDAPGGRPFGLWLLLYALSGFTALSLEIVWFRLMDVAVKSTAFTFGATLSIYLLGCAAGCLLAAGRVAGLRRPLLAFLACQCAVVATAALAVIVLVALPPSVPLYRWFVYYWASYAFFPFGHDWDALSVSRLYLLLPVALFGLPTVLMGLSFPILQHAVHDDERMSGRRVGVLQAANIVGCVAGSLLVSLVALRLFGTSGTLRLLTLAGAGYAAIGLWFFGRRFAWAVAALIVLAAALPGGDRLWRRLHGVVDPAVGALFEEDGTSVVALTAEGAQAWRVSINGKGISWLPYGGVHTLLGALPAVIHPAPRDVAVIGLGAGDTAWAAGCRPETQHVRVFEIASPQPRILRRLSAIRDIPELRTLLEDPRVEIRLADGRRAMEADEARYDVIEIDATWPESALSGNLYSVEFFTRCARRLKPGGVMCTWAPTARVEASFRRVFPHAVQIEVAGLILIGSPSPLPVDRERWLASLRSAEAYLGDVRAREIAQHIDGCRASPDRNGGPREVNEDLFPRDEFASPQAVSDPPTEAAGP